MNHQMRRENKYRTNHTVRKNVEQIVYQRNLDDHRPLPHNRNLDTHTPGAIGKGRPLPKEGMKEYTPKKVFERDHVSANKPYACKGREHRSARKWLVKQKKVYRRRKRLRQQEQLSKEVRVLERDLEEMPKKSKRKPVDSICDRRRDHPLNVRKN